MCKKGNPCSHLSYIFFSDKIRDTAILCPSLNCRLSWVQLVCRSWMYLGASMVPDWRTARWKVGASAGGTVSKALIKINKTTFISTNLNRDNVRCISSETLRINFSRTI